MTEIIDLGMSSTKATDGTVIRYRVGRVAGPWMREPIAAEFLRRLALKADAPKELGDQR